MEAEMNDIKPIRNSTDYEQALATLRELVKSDPAEGTDDDVKISVLSSLIEEYESNILPDLQSDPIEAIKLRIEQLGLKDKDLAKYFGSPSRVSEVLSKKRPLTVSMIKNLDEGLGIPASLLVGSAPEKRKKRWSHKTIELMARRGYFGDENRSMDAESIVEQNLLQLVFNPNKASLPSLLRQPNYRDVAEIDTLHMDAWSSKVVEEGMKIISTNGITAFNSSKINQSTFSDLFQLSVDTDGVKEVITRLSSYGIVVVIEPQLPNTKLDGATFFTENNPIIGLTLRLNRLDYFWFTLAHELAHVLLHRGSEQTAFLDRLFGDGNHVSELEKQADELAGNLLISPKEWQRSPLRYGSTPTLVKKFAEKIGVHESVVAGRIRHDTGSWSILNDSVNAFDVRTLFGDIRW